MGVEWSVVGDPGDPTRTALRRQGVFWVEW